MEVLAHLPLLAPTMHLTYLAMVPYKLDCRVDVYDVSLISKWRERAWGTSHTFDLGLGLRRFGALKRMLEGGLKYITHLGLTALDTSTAALKFDLPPALPCLRRLALDGDRFVYVPSHREAKVDIASLCHRFFPRRHTILYRLSYSFSSRNLQSRLRQTPSRHKLRSHCGFQKMWLYRSQQESYSAT